MKKYVYKTITYEMKDVVMAAMSEHREIIDKYAGEGYRFAGAVPTEQSANGCIRKIDLIFEIDE